MLLPILTGTSICFVQMKSEQQKELRLLTWNPQMEGFTQVK